MEQLITENISTYGPWAVFVLLMLSGVGISLGEDVIIIPAGYLVGTGRLDPLNILLAAYLGVVLSDLLWFLLCSHYGTPLLHRRWFKRAVHPRRLLEAKHQFERRGAWLIVMARFIPGSRTTAITIAGLLHMPFWKFALATMSCVLITAPMQIGLGYLVAKGFGDESLPDAMLKAVGLIMLLVAIAVILRWRSAAKSSKRKPRARATWLRRFRVPGLRRGRDAATLLPIPPPATSSGETAGTTKSDSKPAEE